MNTNVSALFDQGLDIGSLETAAQSPERLAEVAREFEALLVHQLLRQMREASRWNEDEEDSLFGTQLVETIDVELARQLAAGGGLGLAKMLMARVLDDTPVDGPPAGAVSVVPATASYATSPSPVTPVASAPDIVRSTGVPDAVGDALVTSGFGPRRDPIAGDARFHAGVDLRAAYGREVGAAETGRVVFAGEQGGYGLTVVLEHGAGLQTRYAHLSSILVDAGQTVEAREPVGRAGQTGRATGTHLHFELIRDGKPADPTSLEGGLDGLVKKLRLSAD
jgi:murein DD-endopeptidase MepM/ murein hydrolase activator NlpD